MTIKHTHRGFGIVQAWNGYKVEEPTGARWPETYGGIEDAKKSINFELDKVRK